jgi:hypothetical protein
MMGTRIATLGRLALTAAVLAMGVGTVPAAYAQAGNQAIDADLVKPGAPAAPSTTPAYGGATYTAPATAQTPAQPQPAAPGGAATTARAADFRPPNDQTYGEDDLIGAAEGVFGKGAKGLAQVLQDILKKQGKPNGYIIGREAGGAVAVGLRYGSGTLYHRVEGQKPVYWTGPSIGFDAGGSVGKTFMLVYNLYNTEDLYERFAAGEGQAYIVGGFNVSYMRRHDVVLIPVRMGVGLRLGVNGGYMKFSKKQHWMPF